MQNHITKIKKRSGAIVPFDAEKILNAVYKANKAVGIDDMLLSKEIADYVVMLLNERFKKTQIPSIEDIQDLVEETLMTQGHVKTARSFILYREERKQLREERAGIIGQNTDTKLSPNALRILKERYLLKDAKGNTVETPDEMFIRVANNVAKADRIYNKKADIKKTSQEFYDMMASLDFLPNSPTLMNAGAELQQLAACFVLPIEDSMESIFNTLKYAALIHQTGGGTGFSFSRLRPKESIVGSTQGVASGPVSFMNVFNAATEVIKQGGKRRGANMGILRVDHPDILDFIAVKEKGEKLTNFNISVALTDRFMKAVMQNKTYDLIDPRTNKAVRRLNARNIFDLIVAAAWKTGDPGIIFIDRINKANPTPAVGEIESTNPCGELPLLPYEPCNLGSINVSHFIEDGKINFQRLKEMVHNAVHFLDNVIDMSHYPLQQITAMAKANRKIGLGVMGFADLLTKLNTPYNSQEGIKTAEKIISFIRKEAANASEALAKKRGVFPNWKKSIYRRKNKMRNATVLSIAPTGTISMIADCSSGIEPLYALSFVKKVLNGKEFFYLNEEFEKALKKKGIYNEALKEKLLNRASVQDMEEIPDDLKKVFVVSFDINPYWHIKMQAAFQNHIDNAVSKTVNFPNNSAIEDVKEVYLLAYRLGCKGVTIYRDRSKDEQVLNLQPQEARKVLKDKTKCPECGKKLVNQDGCSVCKNCGFTLCNV